MIDLIFTKIEPNLQNELSFEPVISGKLEPVTRNGALLVWYTLLVQRSCLFPYVLHVDTHGQRFLRLKAQGHQISSDGGWMEDICDDNSWWMWPIMKKAYHCLSRGLFSGWLNETCDASSLLTGGKGARAPLPDTAVIFPCVGTFVIRLLLKHKKKKIVSTSFLPNL